VREQIDEQRPHLISSTNRRERINVPEVAYEKGGLRGAETLIIGIAHDPAVAAKLAPDRVAGADEPRIRGGNQPQFRQQQ